LFVIDPHIRLPEQGAIRESHQLLELMRRQILTLAP
jgi:hypothetical protein